ncbi:3-methylmercaptopropionyl-CoA ligase of DmdB2 type [hydrothermal vent metagenome]|uniref:3-methylmercaptopropionyl-CoA ligase of DmdB2 type n=1 Tax=hydrothermal vent metagenome TaxID=652676 RepID=A0A3B0S513_9ZZZZ
MTIPGLMQESDLMISSLLRYASEYHGGMEIVSRSVEGPIHRYTYREAEQRAKQLANALINQFGIEQGDRVGTLAWTTYRHFELFYGVSGMGAVLHTTNPRLFDEQVSYIINHAEDRILFIDLDFVPLVEKLLPELKTVEKIIILTDRDHMPDTSLPGVLCYEDVLAAESTDYDWPTFDERAASSLCYTSGTTGNPKGVLYSHRSTIIHALSAAQNSAYGLSIYDVIMPIAPMYHANAWGLPYVSAMLGAKLVLPGPKMDGAHIQHLIESEGVTFSCAVPTVFSMLFQYLEDSGKKVDTLKRTMIGGSAVPKAMTEKFREVYGVSVLQLWGMTETSPLGVVACPTPQVDALPPEIREDVMDKQGRVQFGLEIKVLDEDGNPVPRDGVAYGDLWVRGAWVTASYYRNEGGRVLDKDGWFPTGDVVTIDQYGYMKITDRSKDVIKSGGEWISSIDIENLAVGHPKVLQAGVVGVFHPKWEERPILVIKPAPGQQPTEAEILDFLKGKIAKWWMPNAVFIIDDMPLTATGKIKKITLRQQYKDCLKE